MPHPYDSVIPESNKLYVTCFDLEVLQVLLIFVQTEIRGESHPQCGQASLNLAEECVILRQNPCTHGCAEAQLHKVQPQQYVSLTWLFPGHPRRVSAPGAGHGTHQVPMDCMCLWGMHIKPKYWLRL